MSNEYGRKEGGDKGEKEMNERRGRGTVCNVKEREVGGRR